MDGIGGVPGSAVRFIGPHAAGEIIARGGFRPNGASAITIFRGPQASGKSSATSFTGATFSVAYSATGIYTVTMTASGWKFPANDPPMILGFGQCKDMTNTNRFEVFSVGGWVAATKSFQLAAWQDTAAFQVPSDAANWIDFIIFGGTKY